MLIIHVGPERYDFLIHKELLCHHSAFFRVALNETWHETKLGTFDLPEEDVELFTIFEQSLYSFVEPISFPDNLDGQSLVIAMAYVAADKYDAVKIKNKSLEKMRALCCLHTGSCRVVFCGTTVKYVFENTSNTSSLRRLLIDLFCYRVTAYTWDGDLPGLPLEFLTGVIHVLSNHYQTHGYGPINSVRESIGAYLEPEVSTEDRKRQVC